MGVLGRVGGAAFKASPLAPLYGPAKGVMGAVGGAVHAIESIFGGGPSANTKAAQQLKGWVNQAIAGPGDLNALRLVYDSRLSKYPAKQRKSVQYLSQMASGTMAWGAPVPPTIQKAAQKLVSGGLGGEVIAWDSNGTVPSVLRGSGVRASTKSARAAQSAPSATPRSLMSSGRTTKKLRDCKYGARVNGYCPKKSAAPKAPKQSKAARAAQRRLETAAWNVATSGFKAAVKAAGGPAAAAGFIARSGLVLGAGVAAYYIASKLRTLRYKTYAELRADAADWYRWARQGRDGEGKNLSPSELAQLSQWYKAKIALLNQHEAAGTKVSGVTNLVFGD